MPEMKLVWPSLDYLPGYVAALHRGWSPDNVRGAAATREELERIAADAGAFLAALVDRDASGAPITLRDGTTVPRLPGYHRWMWDGEFCGTIGLRWQRGTEALPPYCLGHIGYAVVPWKRGRGYATRALRDLLPEARAEGLRYVELTTDPDNVPSQRVIEANGGILVEEFVTPAAVGGRRSLRYRVNLADALPGGRDTKAAALCLEPVSYVDLVARAQRSSSAGAAAHLHTTPPNCMITRSPRRAIVLESAGEAGACAWFSDEPVEALARPLAVLLHGADSVPDDDEPLAPASAAVERMAGRMRGGQGHFHILGPACQVNPHRGRWTIVFEDRELGVLESVSDERPLADIRLVEQLIYRS